MGCRQTRENGDIRINAVILQARRAIVRALIPILTGSFVGYDIEMTQTPADMLSLFGVALSLCQKYCYDYSPPHTNI